MSITNIATVINIEDPVLIAPHGENYHRPKVVVTTPRGVLHHGLPKCGTSASRWLALDKSFAELLERTPCPSCDDIAQETLTDID